MNGAHLNLSKIRYSVTTKQQKKGGREIEKKGTAGTDANSTGGCSHLKKKNTILSFFLANQQRIN
jgi:hypothetical protein